MNNEETKKMSNDKKTILAIDDDLTILTLLRNILQKEYDVCLAKSADAALNILNNTGIDLILLDMEMPTMSGLEFMERLRNPANNFFFQIPVIFVTSHGTKEALLKAAKSGANDFVVKPVVPRILLGKVASLLRAAKKNIPVRDFLLQQLHLMTIACKAGNNTLVEKVAVRLKSVKYNYGTDDHITDICRKALNFDYPAAIRLIKSLVRHNLYDLLKDNEQGNV